MKKYADAIFFRAAKCVAGATFIFYHRAKSEILLAIPSAQCACGLEVV